MRTSAMCGNSQCIKGKNILDVCCAEPVSLEAEKITSIQSRGSSQSNVVLREIRMPQVSRVDIT